MGLKRRAFIQRAGGFLGALGLSETGLFVFTSRVQTALAQSTHRKLALLIGINQYTESVCDCSVVRNNALFGCLTDVELQKELLIHRFGFQPADILMLSDQSATRSSIQSAFMTHLSEQARPGDVVIFHFSGLGSQFKVPDESSIQNSLVPIDGLLPTEDNPFVNDLPLETLGMLLRSLQTQQVTTVLDLSYVNPSPYNQSDLRIRARPSTPIGAINPAELLVQDSLLEQLGASRDQIKTQLQTGQLPGVFLTAAQPAQGAIEGYWNGFNAGLFTYALTQQLWCSTPAIALKIDLGRVAQAMSQQVGDAQQPYLSGQKAQDPAALAYNLKPVSFQGADAVVLGLEDDNQTVRLWLGGIPATVVEYLGVNSFFSVAGVVVPSDRSPAALNDSSEPLSATNSADVVSGSPTAAPLLLQIRSREGLLARARPCCGKSVSSALQAGQLVREVVRVLPRTTSLVIALDTSLERIERVDATSAFSSIPRVSSVVLGEQPADYLFSKRQFINRTLAASLPSELQPQNRKSAAPVEEAPSSKGGYGLFSLGRTAVPNTLVETEEAVKTAVNRLTPHLHTLLAFKLLRLTLNQGSSELGIKATLETVAPQERILTQQETVRSSATPPSGKLAALFGDDHLPSVAIGSHIRYRLENYSDRPLYFMVLSLQSDGNAVALYPPNSSAGNATSGQSGSSTNFVQPGETLILPQPNASPSWVVSDPLGLVETYLVFSRAPLKFAYAALESMNQSSASAYNLNLLANPLEVAHAILKDLHQASIGRLGKSEIPADSFGLDVSAWATLSFLYQVT